MSDEFTENYSISPDRKHTLKSGAAQFLVCGLGSLGQYCIAKLKEFGVTVSAIDVAQPRFGEVTSILPASAFAIAAAGVKFRD